MKDRLITIDVTKDLLLRPFGERVEVELSLASQQVSKSDNSTTLTLGSNISKIIVTISISKLKDVNVHNLIVNRYEGTESVEYYQTTSYNNPKGLKYGLCEIEFRGKHVHRE